MDSDMQILEDLTCENFFGDDFPFFEVESDLNCSSSSSSCCSSCSSSSSGSDTSSDPDSDSENIGKWIFY